MQKIKKIKVFAFAFLSSFFLQSQEYHPVIEDSKYRDIFECNAENICGTYFGARYFFDGDTVIGSVSYKKMKAYPMIQLLPGPYCSPFAVDSSSFFEGNFYREDTSERKLFIYSKSENQEYLLYDFSLSIGDTLESTYHEEIVTVDSVEIITINNGETRKKFVMSSHINYIEGLCRDNGFGPLIMALGGWTAIACIKTDENLYGGQCNYYYVDVEKQENQDIMFFNFNNGNISVNNHIGICESAEIAIWDISGMILYREVMQNQIIKTDELNLKTGMYFITLSCQEKIITKKVILGK